MFSTSVSKHSSDFSFGFGAATARCRPQRSRQTAGRFFSSLKPKKTEKSGSSIVARDSVAFRNKRKEEKKQKANLFTAVFSLASFSSLSLAQPDGAIFALRTLNKIRFGLLIGELSTRAWAWAPWGREGAGIRFDIVDEDAREN